MIKRIVSNFIKVAMIGCLCLTLNVRPAKAFIWPVIDLTEIVSFVNSITTGLNQISNAKSQLDNINNTIKTIGDQVSSIRKYAADLKGTIANIKDNVTKITNNITETTENLDDIATNVDETLNEELNKEKENAENTTETIESQVDSGANEEEVQNTLDEAENETNANKEEVDKALNEAEAAIEESMDNAQTAIDMLMDSLNENGDLSDEDKTRLNEEANDIKNDIEELKTNVTSIINSVKEEFDSLYNEQIAAAFDEYSQAISDYYAGNIDRAGLTQAGETFKETIAGLDVGIDTNTINGIAADAQKIADKIDAFSEDIMNSISNSKGYSDGSEEASNVTTIKKLYVFNYSSNQERQLLKGVYATDADKSFLLPTELVCNGLDVAEIEKDPSTLRECVVKAKAEVDLYPKIYEEALYKDYQKDGIYKHLREDYSIANIVSVSKAKQFSATWGNLEPDNDSNKGTLYVLRKTLKDVDNTRAGYQLMGMTDIESPKLWSEIRRVDALKRAKSMIQDFEKGVTLYLDGRDSDFVEATNRNWGTMQSDDRDGDESKAVIDKAIFSNVILYKCGLRAKDISVSEKKKTDIEAITEKEKNIADCLYKYALEASIGTGDDKEMEKKAGKERQRKAYNDSAFNNLTLAVINNYKSSLDYIDPEKLPNPSEDKNIVSLQDGLKESTTTKDDYSIGAQINYYTTQQILSIVDADAQNQQTEILKDLETFNYNYFGQKAEGES